MDKALGGTGQHILLQTVVAPTLVTTEDPLMLTNALRIVENLLRFSKSSIWYLLKLKCYLRNLCHELELYKSCSYHVPRSWLKSSGNVIVLFEEVGGDPTKLSFATREVGSLCSRVSESHPMPVDMWTSDLSTQKQQEGAMLSLECPLPNQVISAIKFASFGTPQGTCGSFNHGKCRSNNALSVVQKVRSFFFVLSNRRTSFYTPRFFNTKQLQACIGSRNCTLGVSSSTFDDPCAGVTKSLAVEASCA